MAAKDTEPDEERVKQYKAKRIVKTLTELDPDQIEDIVISGEQELSARDVETRGALVHIKDIEKEIDEAYKLWGMVSGITTGLPTLDAKIGGLKPGELILVGGETNNGKSALAQNIAVNVAKTNPVVYITLEMLTTEAGSRIKFMNGGRLDNLDLMFQEEYQIDYRHLEPLFQSGIAKGVKLVVLDYLQYLGRGMTLDEVAKMSKLMKGMALKYKVPFIVIVSLRKSDGGKFKRKWTDIEVEDLMGTSAIGYDADIAIVASRKDLENEYNADHFYIKVIKSRNMPLDYNDRFVTYDWDKTRITETVKPADWTPSAEDIKDAREEELQQLRMN